MPRTVKSPKTKSPKKSPKATASPKAKATKKDTSGLDRYRKIVAQLKEKHGNITGEQLRAKYYEHIGKPMPAKKTRGKRRTTKRSTKKSPKVAGQITVVNPEPMKVDDQGREVKYRNLKRHFYIRKTKNLEKYPLGYKVYVEVKARPSEALSPRKLSTKIAGLTAYNKAVETLAKGYKSGTSGEKRARAREELAKMKGTKKYNELLSR